VDRLVEEGMAVMWWIAKATDGGDGRHGLAAWIDDGAGCL
jgi:hypothetical protein